MSIADIFDRERPVPVVSYEQLRPLLRSVFAWMLAGLLVTTLVAVFTSTNSAMLELRANPAIVMGSFIAQIALVFVISLAMPRLSPAMAAGLFLLASMW